MQTDDTNESQSKAPKRPTYSDPVTESEYESVRKAKAELEGVASGLESRGPLSILRKERAASSAWLRYSGLGIQMAATLVLPVLGGLWLDNEWGSGPWGVVVGGLVGAVASVTGVILTVQRAEAAESRREAREKANREANRKPKE